MNEDLIPTFDIGERVIYHEIPVEFSCPKCGKGYADGTPIRDYKATILGKKTGDLICLTCEQTFPCPDGWYRIETDEPFQGFIGYNKIAVPYTLLEKIDQPFLDFDSLPKNP